MSFIIKSQTVAMLRAKGKEATNSEILDELFYKRPRKRK
jgi:DNA gyrase inhibitor GyrI